MVNPIPEGYPRISANIAVAGAADAIEWYSAVFGMTERMRMAAPWGDIMHAELQLGDALLMLADADADNGFPDPKSIGGTAVVLSIYVEDVDATVALAVERGAEVTREIQDQFWGHRSGTITDPWGHAWNVATQVEEVSPEELDRRMGEMGG